MHTSANQLEALHPSRLLAPMTSESTNCPSGYHHGSNGCYRDHWYIWVWGVLGTLAVLFLAAISFCTYVLLIHDGKHGLT